MFKTKWIGILVLMGIIITVCGGCAEQPFRLHVMANSNSVEDQTVKLAVRDAVLAATGSKIENCMNAEEAEEYIADRLGIILEAANAVLQENGFDYCASAQIGEYHFPEKEYGDVKYPEGDYRALQVLLGEAEGDNWWCVMFPPLCLTELGTELDIEPGEELDEVEYASFFAELFDSVFHTQQEAAP